MRYLQFICAIFLLTFNSCAKKQYAMEEKEIQLLIEECYLNGALNKMETEKMRRGYHKDFAIFFKEGINLQKLPLEDWIAMVNDYKNGPNKNNGLRSFGAEIVQIDVTEDAAFVKLNLSRNNVLVFTDYITLLKFEGKWKIVTKIYHSHIENPWAL